MRLLRFDFGVFGVVFYFVLKHFALESCETQTSVQPIG